VKVSDAIAVLNAGSSSLKFSLFAEHGNALELTVRGQIEGLHTAPRFIAKDRQGMTLGEKSWANGAKLAHDGALDHLVAFLRAELGKQRLTGVGHRAVHGGLEYSQPVRVDATVLALDKYVPFYLCTSRTTWL
jgi:acetate kinase